MKKILLLLMAASLLLSGCASFGKGVAEALMKPQEQDKGECRIFSDGFGGLEDVMARNGGSVKILMIHGIGKKTPGYSTGIVSSLAFKMGLDVTEKNARDINLTDSKNSGRDLGHLRVYRYADKSGSKEMVFYEYTWAGITEPIKSTLLFDGTDFNAEKRTDISRLIKGFINETGTDAVIYLGNRDARSKILDGVSQAFCWMLSSPWENLPENGGGACSADMISENEIMKDYVVITHSLGSQISVDALENVAYHLPLNGKNKPFRPENGETHHQNVRVTIYMFANQLPAIAIGKEKPAVAGMIKDYCTPGAAHYSERFVSSTDIVAFSDPNDVLSYAIPGKFENEHLDSRLCPDITNVLVNVAPLSNIFGKIAANPLEAHSNYKNDDRVLELIIKGVHESSPQSAPDKGCYIVRTRK